MMLQKFAVVSDVHANVEALEAVLKEVDGLELFFLGDFVDYGAEPNEVVETLSERAKGSIIGNHDEAALTGDTSKFNARAAISSKWTRGKLTEKSVAFLKGLPQEMRVRRGGVDFYFTHGSPDDRLWEYVDPRTHSDLFGHYLGKVGVRSIGLGHTHVPYVWREGGGVVFNPGSVGQPRDGDWRASCAVVEVEGPAVEVEVRRVEYDREGAATKIRGAGLPESFADRLGTGD
jgi:putative phosphoesterase